MTRQQRADIEAVRRGLRAGAHSSSKMERQESAARLAALDALLAECDALRRYARAQLTWECRLGTREAEGALPEISAATAALEPYGLSHESIARDLQAAGGGDGDGA